MTAKWILTPLCVLALLAGAARLAVVDKAELRRYRYSQHENAQVPGFGSLVGIDANGATVVPKFNGPGRLLIFAIHHQSIANDIQYWNSVIRFVNATPEPLAAPTQYWGICDAGEECKKYQAEASFSVLGYLDPFEMRIVADADARGEALLYDQFNRMNDRIMRDPDPAAEAKSIGTGSK